jgi:hypothetical protein
MGLDELFLTMLQREVIQEQHEEAMPAQPRHDRTLEKVLGDLYARLGGKALEKVAAAYGLVAAGTLTVVYTGPRGGMVVCGFEGTYTVTQRGEEGHRYGPLLWFLFYFLFLCNQARATRYCRGA